MSRIYASMPDSGIVAVSNSAVVLSIVKARRIVSISTNDSHGIPATTSLKLQITRCRSHINFSMMIPLRKVTTVSNGRPGVV